MKPIIFEKDEVREILAFRKITVERPVKVEPAIRILDKDNPSPEQNKILIGRTPTDERIEVHPPFTVGEGVYVCEEWLDNSKQSFPEAYLYKIDASSVAWQPAETMPKEAARIFLRVKSVKPYKKFDDYWFWVFEFEKVSKTRAEKTMEEE